MQVDLSPEQEAKLSRIAAKAGRGIDDLVSKVLDLYLVHEQQIKAETALILDEADALFEKRTEVHDSHDRYSNQDSAPADSLPPSTRR